MKKVKLKLENIEIKFDTSNLELRRKGTIYKSESRTCREFTIFKEPMGIRISLEDAEYTPIEFQTSNRTLLEYQSEKYLKEDICSEEEDIKDIICEFSYCYLPIESFDKKNRMILFAQTLGEGKYLKLNVSGYDYDDGTKKSTFNKLYKIGEILMKNLTIK